MKQSLNQEILDEIISNEELSNEVIARSIISSRANLRKAFENEASYLKFSKELKYFKLS